MANGITRYSLHHEVVQLIFGQLLSQSPRQKKTQAWTAWVWYKSLAIPYFRMANCHTIIGAKRFHFRVRDGIGWFTLAMVTKQTGVDLTRSRCLYFASVFAVSVFAPCKSVTLHFIAVLLGNLF